MNTIKFFAPSIVWLIVAELYVWHFTGWGNIFSMLPWETFLFVVLYITPVLMNYIMFTMKTRIVVISDISNQVDDAEIMSEEQIEIQQMLTISSNYKEIPIESLHEGIFNLVMDVLFYKPLADEQIIKK